MMTPPNIEPWDRYNQELVSHVHPSDWTNPTPSGSYNLVVIGAGTAGLVTAMGAAGLGAKVALVEKHLMGGDCLNVGCVPSKAILRAARSVAEIKRSMEFGVTIKGGIGVDFGEVMERMRCLRASISPHDSAKRFRDQGVDVFFGKAHFADRNSVEVEGQRLPFVKAVIATGARASAPPIPGLTDVPYLTNETLFSLTELPRRLAVIGAGPIGCEMAQAFARLCSEVWLIETVHGILPREDRDAAGVVAEALAEDGVNVLCCGRDLEVSKPDYGIRLQVQSHKQAHDLEVDQLLVATGRAPNVEGLGLRDAGVEFDEKGVKVNDHLQTTNPNVYACGDVCSRFQFTHAADFMARIVIENALSPLASFGRKAKASRLVIPWCTYTSPQLAHVGLLPDAAKASRIDIDTFTVKFGTTDRAILDGSTEGFVRIHLRKGSDQIVGATIVGDHAGELICEVTMAMKCGLGLLAIKDTIHPYPTLAEAVRRAGDAYNRTRFTPALKGFMERWLKWQRRG